MEQKELRDLERKCIQEQPPQCNAACPIHLDVRSLVKQVASGRWDQAYKVLYRTMPFPGLLGRICDHPCQDKCLRVQVGDPIQIGLLERFVVSQPPPFQRIQPLPAREQPVAVIGSGLAGLTAAWDLGRKGYRVTVFEPGNALGNLLLDRHSALTRELVDRELAILDKLQVTLVLTEDIRSRDFLDQCLERFPAVILSLDAVDPQSCDLPNQFTVEPILQTTGRDGLFAAGQSDSPVWQAAEGRWAATSADRYLQKVSLTAGREKDGPFVSSLYTSLAGIPEAQAVAPSDPVMGYTETEAREEAARCIQCECLECVKVCAYLENFGAYPKKYAREIYNNESIVMGTRQANKLINSCSLCGLCEQVCPNDFPMQDLCLTVRQSMVKRGKMPPSAHEFALLDMAYSQSERFALARHQSGFDQSAYLFFPGCQLSSSSPEQVALVYRHLTGTLSGGVGLMLNCCGAPAYWAGRQDDFLQAMATMKEIWEGLNRPRLVTACSTCFQMFKDHLTGCDPVSLWEVFEQKGCPPVAWRPADPVALHDPCTTRHEAVIRNSVRRMLEQVDVPFEELDLSGETTECCGFGGLMQNANPKLAQEVITRRAQSSEKDFLAYCAMCRDALAGVDKRAVHLLDLFYPARARGDAFSGPSDPADRQRPFWSERQENRARLKEGLLKEFWYEDFSVMVAHQNVKLMVSEPVRTLLNQRRILLEDLQKTIFEAEKTGRRFRHPQTGRYRASFKPYKVTFWVEYSPVEDGFEIHNAYAHRMEIVEGVRRDQ